MWQFAGPATILQEIMCGCHFRLKISLLVSLYLDRCFLYVYDKSNLVVLHKEGIISEIIHLAKVSLPAVSCKQHHDYRKT